MSCFNSSRWLNDAIFSVTEQTFRDFEFIIVNDGSTDDSLEIINQFACHDTRIVVISKQNSGLADSLNVGIQYARGEWIARLDSDDICEPTRLEKQLNRAKENLSLVFIGSGLTIIDEFGIPAETYLYPERHASLLKNLYSGQMFPPHSSAFFRAKNVRDVGGYRTRIKRAEDCDLWLRLAEVGELGCIKEPLVRVRKHADQISHDNSGKRQIIDAHIAMISYWLRRSNAPDPIIADEYVFESFYNWVEARLIEERLFDFIDYVRNVKAILKRVFKHQDAIFELTKTLMSKPIFFSHYVSVRFFGRITSRRLAREWILKDYSRI
jgi:glycosyltransferase involved in cell wall biosynthesis